MSKLVLRGGMVVTPRGIRRADVTCVDGAITSIGEAASDPDAVELDCGGAYVLPGGVDPHCHLMSGLTDSTTAALLGGTTTALSFSLPEDGESTLSAFRRAAAKVDADEAMVDVGLHAMCYRPNVLDRPEIDALALAGADAIKIFLAYPELGIMATGDGLHRVMTAAREAGLPVQVHCEDGEIIEALVEQASGERANFHPETFAAVRPPALEAVAVERALTLAAMTGARLYITHVSSRAALRNIERARADGQVNITAEACLHHVLLDASEYMQPTAGPLLVAPPLRPDADVRAVQAAVADGAITTLGSDHSQSRTPVDERLCACANASYGIAGIGARLPLFLSWGMERGVPIEHLVRLLSTGPADTFGYPAKGRLAPGADADLVVWDPVGKWVVDERSFPDKTGMAPYAGRVVTGRVRAVVRNGEVAVKDGELLVGVARPGRRLVPSHSGAIEKEARLR